MRHLSASIAWCGTAFCSCYLFCHSKEEAAAMLGFLGFLFVCWIMAQKD